jgi:hypothetical protein
MVKRPHVCADPFHLAENAETFEHRCGHQVFEWPCGWTADDHDYEECDGRTVAELEEAR